MRQAIICDIDGTLAIMKDRSPFDWGRVGEDELNQAVALVLHSVREYGDTDIILLSGRDEICKKETEEWLTKYGIPYNELYMRPQGNNEKDTIIKRKLFDVHIYKKYNVYFVMDDRPCVIKMWRDMGLFCFDCGNNIE